MGGKEQNSPIYISRIIPGKSYFKNLEIDNDGQQQNRNYGHIQFIIKHKSSI